MGATRILLHVKDKYKNWELSEKRLKKLRGQGLADGRLQQPKQEIGRQLKPSPDNIRESREAYFFNKEWRLRRPAKVGQLVDTFEVTSGELVWGHVSHIIRGILNTTHDNTFTERKPNVATGGTVVMQGWEFRVAAKIGTWKVAMYPIQKHL